MKNNQEKVVKLSDAEKSVSSPVVQKYCQSLKERGIAYEVIKINPAPRNVTTKP